jgi:glycosyltransferase involved in cell wall biosynthesis
MIAEAPTSLLDQEIDAAGLALGGLTHGMLLTWLSRPCLQREFDVRTVEGRRAIRRWFLREQVGRGVRALWRPASALVGRFAAVRGEQFSPGVNLIGYAHGVLGMGEHVRMSALAMQAADVPGAIVNFTLGLGERREPVELGLPPIRAPRHRCNVFHVNADQMPRTYLHLGSAFFRGRYNIGYWAWELGTWPREWLPAIGTVDEIWAPSQFIRDAIAPATRKPVQWMPLCVELPAFRELPRSAFGVPNDAYLFVFTFDGHSYFERKNPRAAVRAFQAAFPSEGDARLIIKTMHSDVCADEWRSLVLEAGSDDRIQMIDDIWPREKVLALINTCDAYVSLHRSEGFGRGPAEAMLLGKPVIVTDYSGTRDFCRKDNTLLVDCHLVAVEEGSYVGGAGQVWADPSIECAARHMRALFADRRLGHAIGVRARRTISEEFNAEVIGRRYRARLDELGMLVEVNG